MSNYAKSLAKLRSSALGAATVRALAHLESDEAIRNPDTLAMRLLDQPPAGSDNLTAFKQQLNQILPGAYHFQNARTRCIDQRMLEAVASGFRQVLLLGAGFDTRPYRLQAPGVHFVEVDLPELQLEKQRKMAAILGALPANVSYLPLDLNQQPLEQIAASGMLDMSQPVFINWEGVSYYLTAAGVDSTLKFIAEQTAPGSRVLFDYMPANMIDGSVDYYGGAESRAYMAEFGEPVIFGIPDQLTGPFLLERGLQLVEDIGPDELALRYLRRADGAIDGRVAGYIRMAEALVEG